MESRYIVGLDLGQSQDYTALIVAECQEDPDGEAHYNIRHLERFQLGQAYPTIVNQVQQRMKALEALWQAPYNPPRVDLVVDATGVGKPVLEYLRQADLNPIGIHIHGGDAVHREWPLYRVPKRDLVGVLQVLLQTQRLKIAQTLPMAKTLVEELLNFKVKIDPQTAHDSYSAWRENIHDDLVLAVAVACWYVEQAPKSKMVKILGI